MLIQTCLVSHISQLTFLKMDRHFFIQCPVNQQAMCSSPRPFSGCLNIPVHIITQVNQGLIYLSRGNYPSLILQIDKITERLHKVTTGRVDKKAPVSNVTDTSLTYLANCLSLGISHIICLCNLHQHHVTLHLLPSPSPIS